MNKRFIGALVVILGISATEAKGEEVVKSLRLNVMGGNFDEGALDEDVDGVSAEFEIGLRNGNITNSLGFGINYYDWDNSDADVTTLELYYSPRYTFDNNWYVAGRLGYSIGDADDSYRFLGTNFEDEVDMTGFVFGVETGYTFQNDISVHLGYKAVESEVTVKNKASGAKYSEDGYTHLGYLGIGYNF